MSKFTATALLVLFALPACGGSSSDNAETGEAGKGGTDQAAAGSANAGSGQAGASNGGAGSSQGGAASAGSSSGGAGSGQGGASAGSSSGGAPAAGAGGMVDNTHKLTQNLSQPTGCKNDSSLAFCIKKDDAVSLQAAKAAFGGNVSCNFGVAILKCDAGSEQACVAELDPSDCVSSFGAMTDSGWKKVLALIALDGVTKVGPFFFTK